MVSKAQVDRSMFDAAIREYVKTTSKSTVDAINGKSRDLLFKAYKNTPHSLYDRTWIENYYRERPKIISAICNKKYGRGGWNWDTWSYILGRVILKAMRSKSYMRSGFVKGAKQIQATAASKELALPAYAKKFTNVHAQTIIATASRLRTSAEVSWGGESGMDAQRKEEMLNKALQSGLRAVTADIANYLQKKLNKQAKKNSGC